MSQKIIRAKFMVALAAYASAHSPVLTIAREGQGFVKPTDGSSFLEAIIFPANTTNPTTDGLRKRYWGDFTVNVWTKDSIGTDVGETIAEEVASLFPVVPKSLLPVSVEETPSVKRAVLDAGWRIIPVCVSYRAEF